MASLDALPDLHAQYEQVWTLNGLKRAEKGSEMPSSTCIGFDSTPERSRVHSRALGSGPERLGVTAQFQNGATDTPEFGFGCFSKRWKAR